MKKYALFAVIFLSFLAQNTYADTYLLKVDFRLARLSVFNENNKEVGSYTVALPRVMPKLPIEGRIKKIERNPHWFPTRETREAYLKKFKKELPLLIPPGDPRNAMGKCKLHIIFSNRKVSNTIRIHGTNDESSIGKRVSRGCIRMRNEDIMKLSEIIQGKETLIIFD